MKINKYNIAIFLDDVIRNIDTIYIHSGYLDNDKKITTPELDEEGNRIESTEETIPKTSKELIADKDWLIRRFRKCNQLNDNAKEKLKMLVRLLVQENTADEINKLLERY